MNSAWSGFLQILAKAADWWPAASSAGSLHGLQEQIRNYPDFLSKVLADDQKFGLWVQPWKKQQIAQ